MKQKVIFENGCAMLRNMEYEEDLPYRSARLYNRLPEDVVCDCCLKPITQLKPFKASDVGDIDGVLLVLRWREDDPFDEETHKALDEACECYENDGYENMLDWLADKYGKEKAEDFYVAEKRGVSVFKSWECLDCVVLDDDEYFERRYPAQDEHALAPSEC